MCSYGAAAAAAIVAGAGATYYGQSQANAATSAAADAAAAQQRNLQLKQLTYQDQQDEAHQRSKDIFNTQVIPAINADRVQAEEASQSDKLKGIFRDASSQQIESADPTRVGDVVSTEGSPTSGGAESAGSKAYDAAYAQNLTRALNLTNQRGDALAGITGRQFAAEQQRQLLERTGQGIYQNNDKIAGLGGLVAGQGRLMDAAQAAAQAQINAAGHKGDTWKSIGQIVGAVGGVLGGGWGSLANANAQYDAQNTFQKGTRKADTSNVTSTKPIN